MPINLTLLVFSLFLAVFTLHPDSERNTQQMAIAHGYPAENFTYTTPDNYIITVFRIPGHKNESLEEAHKRKRQPVILQHGILCCSDQFLDNEDPSLVYLLADSDFDVWVGNFRGNEYSRFHAKYNPDKDADYWDFSIDEIIAIDHKSMFDFIIKKTGFEKISYIGHSMGGGTIIAAASEDPEYYGKHLRSYVGLGPGTSLAHSNTMLKFAHEFSFFLKILRELGVWELFNMHDHVYNTFRIICSVVPDLCSAVIYLLADENPDYDNYHKYDVFFSHYPDGTSMNQAIHIIQQTERQGYYKFRRYWTDPYVAYNFTKIPKNVPYLILSGMGDKLVNYEDIRWMRNEMAKSGAQVDLIEYDGFGHLTFLLPLASREPYVKTLEFTKRLGL